MSQKLKLIKIWFKLTKTTKQAEQNPTLAILITILKTNLFKIKRFHFQLLMDNSPLIISWEIQ